MKDKRPEWQEEKDRMREHRNFVKHFPFHPLEKPASTTEPQNNSVLNVMSQYTELSGSNRIQ
jgi:hypothetical protein